MPYITKPETVQLSSLDAGNFFEFDGTTYLVSKFRDGFRWLCMRIDDGLYVPLFYRVLVHKVVENVDAAAKS